MWYHERYMTITVAFVFLTVLLLSSSAKMANEQLVKSKRRGDPQRQSTEAGAPLQNFTAADQSRNSLRLRSSTKRSRMAPQRTRKREGRSTLVLKSTKPHKISRKMKINARRIGTKRKTENFKLLDLPLNSS